MTKILRLPAVIDRTGLPRSTIWAYIDQGKFPSPVRLTSRNVGWVESEITEWIENRIQDSRAQSSKRQGEKL